MLLSSSTAHASHQPGFTFLRYSIKFSSCKSGWVADNGLELVDISKFSRNCLERHEAAVSHAKYIVVVLRWGGINSILKSLSGTFGYIGTSAFVRKIYSTVKID